MGYSKMFDKHRWYYYGWSTEKPTKKFIDEAKKNPRSLLFNKVIKVVVGLDKQKTKGFILWYRPRKGR